MSQRSYDLRMTYIHSLRKLSYTILYKALFLADYSALRKKKLLDRLKVDKKKFKLYFFCHAVTGRRESSTNNCT